MNRMASAMGRRFFATGKKRVKDQLVYKAISDFDIQSAVAKGAAVQRLWALQTQETKKYADLKELSSDLQLSEIRIRSSEVNSWAACILSEGGLGR